MATYYGTSIADSTLTTACKMVSALGGAETSVQTIITGTVGAFAEITSKGLTVPDRTSIPTPATGNGWIFFPGVGTFAAGNWSASITLRFLLHGSPNQTTVRFFKYIGSNGTLTSIGSIVATTATLAKTTYAFGPTSMPAVTLLSGDGIYVELWWDDASVDPSGDNPYVYVSSSGTLGVANDMQITTATFSAGGATTRNGMGRVKIASRLTVFHAVGRMKFADAPDPLPIIPLASDTFTRSNQSGWGTASDGVHTWNHAFGPVTFSVLSNAGHVTGATGTNKMLLGDAVGDMDVVVSFNSSAIPTAVGACLRSTGTNTHYACQIIDASTVRISKTISATFTSLATGSITFATGAYYSMRARIQGSTISVRVWLASATEPTSWDATFTDTSIAGAGNGGIVFALAAAGNTIDFDNFSVFGASSIRDIVVRGRIARAQVRDVTARVRLAGIVLVNMSSDTFIRADQDGWGIASDGEAWNFIDGASSPAIVANTGTITASADTNVMTLGTKQVSDANILIRTSVSSASDDVGIVLRVKDASTYYALYWSHTGQLRVSRFIAGSEIILATYSFSVTPASYYFIRGAIVSQANGIALLQAKIWVDSAGGLLYGSGVYGSGTYGLGSSGASEPAWAISYTDNNPMIGAGYHGVYMTLASPIDVITVTSYAGTATANLRNIYARAGIKLAGYADVLARAAIGGTTSVKDVVARGGVKGLIAADIVSRACLAEALQVLPTPQSASLSFQVNDTFIKTVYSDTSPYVLLDSVQYGDTLDGRSTASFTLIDPTGSVHVSYRQRVSLVHSARGEVFRGFVNTAQENNLSPNVHNSIAIVCIDEHWIPDKRVYEGDEFENENAGDIACQLFSELEEDGVALSYALLHEASQADFAKGTLTNVVAAANVADGDLELAAAGRTLSISETHQADFSSGTLTNVQAGVDGSLALTADSALQMITAATLVGGGNLFSYIKIWSGAVTIAAGDVLAVSTWMSSDSPSQKCGVDIIFTDGTNIRDHQPFIVDQNYLRVHPGTDLGGLAKDQWYDRSIPLGVLAGKVTNYLMIACEGDEVGTYTAYFRHIQIKSASGAVKATIYWSPQSMSYQQISRRGVASSKVTQKWTYAKTGSRVSPAYGLTGVGIARNSLISWKSTLPTDIVLLMESSVDGGQSYQLCTSGAAISGLLPGMGCGGQSILLRETLTNTGKDPATFGTLDAVTVSVSPSFAGSKADVYQVTTTVQDWQRGTLSNLSYANGSLSLGGVTRNWDAANVGGQTLFGAGVPEQQVSLGELALQTNTGYRVTSRFDFAGTPQNFTAEIDVKVGTIAGILEDLGLIYRTTGWQGANDTYAYNVHINQSHVTLARGTNSATGGGAYTQIADVVLTLSSGNYHRLKVAVNGSNHQVYVDDILYINATDATYTAAGFMGATYWNNSGDSSKLGIFTNFGVLPALTGHRISLPLDLSSTNTAWDSWISWDDIPSATGSADITIEASVDNGGTWQECTKNAAIPGITRSLDTTNLSVLTRQTITTQSATEQPTLAAMTLRVVGQLLASGNRISPPISLSQVGRAGSSVVQWKALEPSEATHVAIDVSPNRSAWTDVTANNGEDIPFILPLQDPAYENTFVSDYGSNYTEGALVGTPNGVKATWIVDRGNHVLVGTEGVYAFVAYNGQTLGDGEIIFDMTAAERGGCVWRLSNTYASCYELNVQDDTSQRYPANSMRLMKVVNGVHAQLGNGATITFQRGVSTRFKIVQVGGDITVTVSYPIYASDGVSILGGDTQTLMYTDPAPLAAGMVALRSNGGTNSYSYLRLQQYGDNLDNRMLYVRQRLSTSDPLYTPQVEEITASVRGNTIATGALIPTTTYSVVSGSTNSIAQDLDDVAKQSNYWWRVKNGIPYFLPKEGIPAPFAITGRDVLYGAQVNVIYNSDLYRNEQIMIGGIDIEGHQDIRIADGFRTGFDTDYAIDSISSVLVGGNKQLVGQSNIDTGKDWYYQQGKVGIVQDAGGVILPYGTEVIIDYLGQVPVIVKARNNGQIAYIAAIDGTSGVVAVAEQAEGLSADAEIKLALSRLEQYGKFAISMEWQTYRPGLAAGQFLYVSLSQHDLVNLPTIITNVECVPTMLTISGVQYMVERFTVQCTSGPLVGAWSNLFA